MSERVAEFREEYPGLATLRVSETHGRSLRRELTEATTEEYEVERERGPGVATRSREVDRRALTWEAAVEAFLGAHTDYRDARLRFEKEREGEPGREEFEVSLDDAWGEDYADREYARAKALEREMGREWGDYSTVMLTLTASSLPDGEREAPVDHLREILDTWSSKTYHALRNAMRSLGLERDEWCYWLQGEPHAGGGENACYGHIHVAVYVRGEVSEGNFHRVIDAHVDGCGPASRAAHDYGAADPEERPISVNSDVENLGSYMAEYAGAYGGDLLERPTEYIAWGALHWATNSQRARRSQTANEAVKADRCRQRAGSDRAEQDHDHGECLRHSAGRGPEIECAECGSSWGVPQGETVVEARRGGPAAEDGGAVSAGGPGGSGAGGEGSPRSRWPSARSAARRDGDGVRGFEDPPEWQAAAIVRGEGEDAEEHPVGGGGVDMVELSIPEDRPLWRLPDGKRFRCAVCNFSTYNGRTMRGHVETHTAPAEEAVRKVDPGTKFAEGELIGAKRGGGSPPDTHEEEIMTDRPC